MNIRTRYSTTSVWHQLVSTPFLLILTAALSLASGAQSATLWGASSIGMTRDELRRNFPNIVPFDLAVGGTGLEVSSTVFFGRPARVAFIFQADRLKFVRATISTRQPFVQSENDYLDIVRNLSESYIPRGNITISRPPSRRVPKQLDSNNPVLQSIEHSERVIASHKQKYFDRWKSLQDLSVSVSMEELGERSVTGATVTVVLDATEALTRIEASERQAAAVAFEAGRWQAERDRISSYEAFLAGFRGKRVNKLVEILGAPIQHISLPLNEASYVFEQRHEGETVCRTSVVTRPNGTIYSWKWEGSLCAK